VLYLRQLHETPTRRTPALRTCRTTLLVHQDFLGGGRIAKNMGLGDAVVSVIANLDQPLMSDRKSQLLVDRTIRRAETRLHVRPPRLSLRGHSSDILPSTRGIAGSV